MAINDLNNLIKLFKHSCNYGVAFIYVEMASLFSNLSIFTDVIAIFLLISVRYYLLLMVSDASFFIVSIKPSILDILFFMNCFILSICINYIFTVYSQESSRFDLICFSSYSLRVYVLFQWRHSAKDLSDRLKSEQGTAMWVGMLCMQVSNGAWSNRKAKSYSSCSLCLYSCVQSCNYLLGCLSIKISISFILLQICEMQFSPSSISCFSLFRWVSFCKINNLSQSILPPSNLIYSLWLFSMD